MTAQLADDENYLLVSIAEIAGYLSLSGTGGQFSAEQLELAPFLAAPEYVDLGWSLLLSRARLLSETERVVFLQRILEILASLKTATTCISLNPVGGEKSLLFLGPETSIELIIAPEGWFASQMWGCIEPTALELAEHFAGRLDGEFVIKMHNVSGDYSGAAWGRGLLYSQSGESDRWVEKGPVPRSDAPLAAFAHVNS
jgi:hypothetical protein